MNDKHLLRYQTAMPLVLPDEAEEFSAVVEPADGETTTSAALDSFAPASVAASTCAPVLPRPAASKAPTMVLNVDCMQQLEDQHASIVDTQRRISQDLKAMRRDLDVVKTSVAYDMAEVKTELTGLSRLMHSLGAKFGCIDADPILPRRRDPAECLLVLLVRFRSDQVVSTPFLSLRVTLGTLSHSSVWVSPFLFAFGVRVCLYFDDILRNSDACI